MADDKDIPYDCIPICRPDGNVRSLAEIENEIIDFAMNLYGQPAVVARMLGMGRSTLYRKLSDK